MNNHPGPSPIRVLVVDDSAVVRRLLTRELARDGTIDVVGTAADPYEARDKIAALRPQVLTLDVEMPRMDGITFLRKLMEHFPLPVIIVSSLTGPGTKSAVEAMACGAVEVVAKPDSAYSAETLGELLTRKVHLAAAARVTRVAPARDAAAHTLSRIDTTDKLIALGASTGGVQALTEVLTRFPPNAPPTVVVQHMPPKFTRSFADRLSRLCRVAVKEAMNGESVLPGTVLIAPGGAHMVLRRSGARYVVNLTDAEPVWHQKPSVDVLFASVAQHAGVNTLAALLTGMGEDGAVGLKAIHDAGGKTIAQDEATCVVFGMPKEAIRRQAADRVLPLGDIANQLLAWAAAPACTTKEPS